MAEAVIVAAARTPVGNFGGAFRDVSATQLGVVVARALVERARLDPALLEEVICGVGGMLPKESNVARQISLFAGFPLEVPAFTVQRNCAAGLQSLVCASRLIRLGEAEVVMALGAENMSQAPYQVYGARWGLRLRHGVFSDTLWEGLTDGFTGLLMGETAENLVDQFGFTRRQLDEVALASHQKAFRAQRMGKFKEEIVPVSVPSRRPGDQPEVVVQDEGPQAGLSLERLALAPAVFRKGGSVTPGNSCPMNDAAAGVLVMSEKKAAELGLEPLAWVKSWGFAGVDPRIMGIGPVPATKKALARAGLELGDIGLIEINEAFAAQYLACRELLGFSDEIANVNGGGLALGHPIGATGLRLINTLVYEMRRREVRYGLATMCVGGGQGGAVILERR
ncbi:MAG: thiolase family protein [Bacillota bacterium]|nr:thiolase family protein [Bacillota bacterium]